MQQNFNNLNNMNINNIYKMIFIFSFMFQWSILSFIINLVTLWTFSHILFVIFIIDAISMLIIKNKTIKRPSFILSKIWDLLEFLHVSNGQNPNIYDISRKTQNFSYKVQDTYNSIKTKISNTLNKITNFKQEHNKYQTERNKNKFSKEIGKKVTVEQITYGKKLQKKSFKYRDRTMSYIKVLEKNGYKDYTKYNLDPNISNAYIIVNKNKDIIDVKNNSIAINHNTNDYKIVLEGWPKK